MQSSILLVRIGCAGVYDLPVHQQPLPSLLRRDEGYVMLFVALSHFFLSITYRLTQLQSLPLGHFVLSITD
jgi:hypothetical protein